jgi:hypothetical protein
MNKEALKSIYAYNMLFNNSSGNISADGDVKMNTHLISDFDLQNFNPKRFEYYTTLLKMFDNDPDTLTNVLNKYYSVKSLKLKERKLIRIINDYVNKINKTRSSVGGGSGGGISVGGGGENGYIGGGDGDDSSLIKKIDELEREYETSLNSQQSSPTTTSISTSSMTPNVSSIRPKTQSQAQEPNEKFLKAIASFKAAIERFQTNHSSEDDIYNFEESINTFETIINSQSGGVSKEILEKFLENKNKERRAIIPKKILDLAKDIIAVARKEVKLARVVFENLNGKKDDNTNGNLQTTLFSINVLDKLTVEPIKTKIVELSKNTTNIASEADITLAKASVLEAYAKEYVAFAKLQAELTKEELTKARIIALNVIKGKKEKYEETVIKKVSDANINKYKKEIYDTHKETEKLDEEFQKLHTVSKAEQAVLAKQAILELKVQVQTAKAHEGVVKRDAMLLRASAKRKQGYATEAETKLATKEAEARGAKVRTAQNGISQQTRFAREDLLKLREQEVEKAVEQSTQKQAEARLAIAEVITADEAVQKADEAVQKAEEAVQKAEEAQVAYTQSSQIKEDNIPTTLIEIRNLKNIQEVILADQVKEEAEKEEKSFKNINLNTVSIKRINEAFDKAEEEVAKAENAKENVSTFVNKLKDIANSIKGLNKAPPKNNQAGLELTEKVNKDAKKLIEDAKRLLQQSETQKEFALVCASKAETQKQVALDCASNVGEEVNEENARRQDPLALLSPTGRRGASSRIQFGIGTDTDLSSPYPQRVSWLGGGASPEDKYNDDTLKAQYLEKQRYRSISPRIKEEFRDVLDANKGKVVRIKTDNKIDQLSNDIDIYNALSVEDRDDNTASIIKKIKDFENDPQNPLEELEITLDDRIVFIIATFFIRYITLLMVQWCIDINIITSFYEGFIYYAIIYIILFWFVVLFINIDNSYDVKYMNFNGIINSIRSLFYYFYMGTNGISRLLIHTSLIILLIVIPIILNIKKKPEFRDEANDEPVANVKILTYDERKQLSKTLTLFTMFIWLFTSIIATKF